MVSVRLFLLAMTVCVAAVTSVAATPYKPVTVKNGGTISGFVRLTGVAPRDGELETLKDNDWCGTRRPLQRLIIGKKNGVRYAVVSIENISTGKPLATPGKHLIDQRKCLFEPHVTVLPKGASLEIVNSDGVLHNVHAYAGEAGEKSLFNIAQPVKGVRFPIKPEQFRSPGVYSLTCDAGHPWMSGYVVVAEHPYYAVTGADGSFELTDVPPGTYTVKMWHEGVHVKRILTERGKPSGLRFEPPYEERAEVVVPGNGNATVQFTLTLRAEAVTEK